MYKIVFLPISRGEGVLKLIWIFRHCQNESWALLSTNISSRIKIVENLETEKRANLFSIGAKSKAMQLSNIVSFSGQEMFSEINFSLFLPLQNSNVVYLETFCANTVSETGWRTAASCCIFSKQRKPLFVYYLPSPLHCRPNRWLHYYIVLWIAGNCIMVEVPATKTGCNIFQYVVACSVVTVQCRV